MTVEEIIARARGLSLMERLRVINELERELEIPEPPGEDVSEGDRVDSLAAELRHRWESYRRGETKAVDARASIVETLEMLERKYIL